MSKIRIYELAKELGVDNKIVINKAVELGFSGKASHSNSLDGDEADQIRRAVIRQAIGAPQTAETVTTRVDKTTGTTNTVVERRSGNVIRRRKQEGGDGGGLAQVEEAPTVDLTYAARATEAVPHPDSLFRDSGETREPQGEFETNGNHATEAAQELLRDADEEIQETAEAPAEVVEPEEAPPAGEETKKTIGPRVLGKIELPVKRVVKPEAKRAAGVVAGAPVVAPTTEEEEEEKRKGAQKKRSRKREISRIDLVDYEGREMRRPKSHRGGHVKDDSSLERKQAQLELTKPKQSKRVVKMSETITVGELSKQMSLKAGEVISKLIELGIMATINQAIDQETATIIAEEFGFQIESTDFDETEILQTSVEDTEEHLEARAPVVTVMGHVDHGKTSLLDAIRKSSVAEREHGGITQHIGAYRVQVESGKQITFIDTPGHAAFTSMRARGAQVTDIVVLVVAIDDGVMPQTIEAINHAKAAKVPIVVAINKIDKGGTPDQLKQQLVGHGLQPEEWGGDTMFFQVSATTGKGLKELLDGILLQAEVKELKANPNRRAHGTIIESRQDKGRGTVATVLVQNGTLKVGEVFVAGAVSGKVRSMVDHNGDIVEAATPSTPVEITGLSDMPEAGDDFFVVENEVKAREVALNRAQRKAVKEERALATGPISLEEFARRANNLIALELPVIVKADVQGSLEALEDAIEKLSTEKVKVRVVHAAVGGVNESDVQLAIASKAVVIGFGVRAEPRAMSDAERAGIEIRFYRIIYDLIDDVKKAMAGLLAPIKQEVQLGRVEVRETFNVSKLGTIAGCFVVDGAVRRGAFVRLLRDSRVVFEGKMGSLRRFKDDVREVSNGYECGIGLENFNDVKPGDTMEVFEVKEVAATLE